MKRILTGLAIVLFATVASGASVHLAWDPSDGDAPEGYRIFVTDNLTDAPAAGFDFASPAWTGPATTLECQIDGLDAGKTYRFVARSYAGPYESADSNILEWEVPGPGVLIKYAKKVKGFKIKNMSE